MDALPSMSGFLMPIFTTDIVTGTVRMLAKQTMLFLLFCIKYAIIFKIEFLLASCPT